MPHRRPPNLVLILTDQQRYDSLGCTGGRAVATPHLDRLAAEGLLFERAYCTNPICTPSRASLLTGHHLPRHGVSHLDSVLIDGQTLLSHRLQRRGYFTGLVGKLHVQAGGIESRRRHPRDGFDVYELYYGGGAMMESPLNAYAPWCRARRPEVYERLVRCQKQAGVIPREVHMNTWAAERSAAFLDEAGRSDRPFFLMVSVFDPHNPYDDHPPEAEARVDPDALRPVIPPPQDRGDWPEAIHRHAADNYFVDGRTLSARELGRMRIGYHAEVGMIDDLVGQVRRQLEERGQLDDTLLLFCSDHGDLLGDHGLMVKGGVPYESNIRVPAIVRLPRGGSESGGGNGPMRRGDRVRRPVQLNDFAAMMLRASGVSGQAVRRAMPDAIDPLSAWRDASAARREVAVHAYRNSGLARGHVPYDPPVHLTLACDGRFKLVLYHDPPIAGGRPAVSDRQLFDLDQDPDERRNLIDQPAVASARRRLRTVLDEFFIQEAALRFGAGD